jgi:hypothetical protein
MAEAAQRFYKRYYMLTGVMPAVVMALLFYGTAWLCGPASPFAFGTAGKLPWIGFGFFVFIGLSRILAGLGFLLSGVPAARVEPSLSQRASLALALPQDWPAQVAIVELGTVPFIAAAGGLQATLYVSTHSLEHTNAPVLRALLAHELAHLQQQPGCAWYDLSWLLAYPLAWLVHSLHTPILLPGFAALQISAWLHFMYWLKQRG